MKLSGKLGIDKFLPSAYFDNAVDIVPLRFVWSQPDSEKFRNYLSRFINVRSFWFLKPIVASSIAIEKFGYIKKTCPVSEILGSNIINFPCNISLKEFKVIKKKLLAMN